MRYLISYGKYPYTTTKAGKKDLTVEQSEFRNNTRTFIAIPIPKQIILFLMKIQEIIKAKGFKETQK